MAHGLGTVSQLRQNNSEQTLTQDGTRQRTSHPMRLESTSELQDQTGHKDSVVQEVSTLVYIAPKTPTLQVTANLDFESRHGTPEQPEQCLQGGDNAKAPSLSDPMV
jgi:hypothetical protein